MKYYFFALAFALFSSKAVVGQTVNPNHQKVSTALSEYYKLDRENIHLHLNKNVYLNNEEIWFKGYIIEKKSMLPFVTTSNVYIELLDSKGSPVNTKLFFAENSTFQGKYSIPPAMKSGIYYLHAYTNYMNNFDEDESALYKFTVMNVGETNFSDPTKINYATAQMTFYPESGTLLEGTSNTIGVRIADCNGNGIPVRDAQVLNAQGTIINTFSTTDSGYGRFDLLNTTFDVYKVTADINGRKIESTLPKAAMKGAVLSVNNFTFPTKATLKIKTNARTLGATDEKYTLVIQKDDIASFVDFTFKGQHEQTLVLTNDELADGVNTISLLDNALQMISQRIIYKPIATAPITLSVAGKSKDSVTVFGSGAFSMAELSISVLPMESASRGISRSIESALSIDNYIVGPTTNIDHLLNGFNRVRSYELDNILITKQPKYSLENILRGAPMPKHDFDTGLTIKGTVNNTISDRANYRVQMQANTLGLNATEVLNEKNEVYFKNVMVTDSARVHFSLLNKNAKATELKMIYQLVNNKRKFKKTYQFPECIALPTTEAVTDFPKIEGAINLEGITVTSKAKKDTLTNVMRYGNSMARGYKISPNESDMYRDVLAFIQGHGYNVTVDGVNVSITSRSSTTLMGSRSPRILIDDVPLNDFSLLANHRLTDVDEIYIDTRGYGGGMGGSNGVIRIYNKKLMTGANSYSVKIKSQSFLIENGFQPFQQFTTPEYENVKSPGFRKFGVIQWQPSVTTDANGSFKFQIPELYQKEVRVLIEGISSTGRVVSEEVILKLE